MPKCWYPSLEKQDPGKSPTNASPHWQYDGAGSPQEIWRSTRKTGCNRSHPVKSCPFKWNILCSCRMSLREVEMFSLTLVNANCIWLQKENRHTDWGGCVCMCIQVKPMWFPCQQSIYPHSVVPCTVTRTQEVHNIWHWLGKNAAILTSHSVSGDTQDNSIHWAHKSQHLSSP